MQKIRNFFSRKHTKKDSDLNNGDALSTPDMAGTSTALKLIKIHVICPSARVMDFQVKCNKTLAELKNDIILQMSEDPTCLPIYATDMRQLAPRFRIYKADIENEAELHEECTMDELHIKDSDTLFISLRRNILQNLATRANDYRSPTDLEIRNATRHIPSTVSEVPLTDINEIFQQSNLQFDVRKVLISLAQKSAIILGQGPYAKRLIDVLKQRLINKRNLSKDTLTSLIDMGFEKEKAEYALKMVQGSYAEALEWLIQKQTGSAFSNEEEAAMNVKKSDSFVSPSTILTNNTALENTQALQELVRIYGHRDVPPSAEMIKILVEMDFKENEVVEALRKTCNNKAAAIEWLLGYRSGSLIELRDGLSKDSQILQKILDLPQVQMNLGNPKVFLAFLSILENEQTLKLWGAEGEITEVITNILQKYHEEKHISGINQFYPSF